MPVALVVLAALVFALSAAAPAPAAAPPVPTSASATTPFSPIFLTVTMSMPISATTTATRVVSAATTLTARAAMRAARLHCRGDALSQIQRKIDLSRMHEILAEQDHTVNAYCTSSVLHAVRPILR